VTTATLTTVDLGQAPLDRFRTLLDQDPWRELESTMGRLSAALRGRVLWNVNSTAQGGGVAELLASLIPYDRGAGIDERWVVISGSPPFFAVTKRLHNMLHGGLTDDLEISAEERRVYDETMERNAALLVEVVRPGDPIIIHDPQAAGLVPLLARHGAHVIWRSHVGVDAPNDSTRAAWNMLRPYLGSASALVFSRRTYVWEGLDRSRVHVIAPAIDPFSVKNQELDEKTVGAVLAAAGIVQGPRREALLRRADGGAVRVTHAAEVCGGVVPPDARLVVQVSRWDGLKDPVGVMQGFAERVAPVADSRLVLAGPGAGSVRDDPEQPEVLRQAIATREQMSPQVRDSIHIAQLPTDDVDENAAIVNALQRRADVVVQKSLAEGFGLTVAEAMWKGRPILASRVGGIEDQIEHGKSGLLIDDPRDLAAFGDAAVQLLNDRAEADRLGHEAKRRAIRQFLAPRHLVEQARLVMRVLQPNS